MRKKKNLTILLLIAIVGVIGLTLAYFTFNDSLDNVFTTKKYASTVTDEFVSPTNWLPGDVTTKTITATNTGEIDEAVRISYTEEWKNNNGVVLSGLIDSNGLETNSTINSEKAAIIKFINGNDWTLDNGYYYYNYRLEPNEVTSSLTESVTFNSKVRNSSNCVTTESNGVKTISCESTGDGYDGATYKLTFTVESVQYNKYKEAWGTTVNILEEKPQDKSLYASGKISGLSVGSTIDPNSYQTGYDFESANSVHFKYVIDDEYKVTEIDVCKKETVNAPSICLIPNNYTYNKATVLSYYGGDINNMPSSCSIDTGMMGEEELTCTNSYVVIGVDDGGGVFINDIENGKSCVANSVFGVNSCK